MSQAREILRKIMFKLMCILHFTVAQVIIFLEQAILGCKIASNYCTRLYGRYIDDGDGDGE